MQFLWKAHFDSTQPDSMTMKANWRSQCLQLVKMCNEPSHRFEKHEQSKKAKWNIAERLHHELSRQLGLFCHFLEQSLVLHKRRDKNKHHLSTINNPPIRRLLCFWRQALLSFRFPHKEKGLPTHRKNIWPKAWMVPVVSCCSPSVHEVKPHYSHHNEGPVKEQSLGGDWEVTLHHALREKDKTDEVWKEDKSSERSGWSKISNPTPHSYCCYDCWALCPGPAKHTVYNIGGKFTFGNLQWQKVQKQAFHFRLGFVIRDKRGFTSWVV